MITCSKDSFLCLNPDYWTRIILALILGQFSLVITVFSFKLKFKIFHFKNASFFNNIIKYFLFVWLFYLGSPIMYLLNCFCLLSLSDIFTSCLSISLISFHYARLSHLYSVLIYDYATFSSTSFWFLPMTCHHLLLSHHPRSCIYCL